MTVRAGRRVALVAALAMIVGAGQWLLLSAESGKGISSVLRRFGGQRLELQRVRCPGDPLRDVANIVWRDCVVRYRGEGPDEHERALFAAIIERDGRFKFFSYATPL